MIPPQVIETCANYDTRGKDSETESDAYADSTTASSCANERGPQVLGVSAYDDLLSPHRFDPFEGADWDLSSPSTENTYLGGKDAFAAELDSLYQSLGAALLPGDIAALADGLAAAKPAEDPDAAWQAAEAVMDQALGSLMSLAQGVSSSIFGAFDSPDTGGSTSLDTGASDRALEGASALADTALGGPAQQQRPSAGGLEPLKKPVQRLDSCSAPTLHKVGRSQSRRSLRGESQTPRRRRSTSQRHLNQAGAVLPPKKLSEASCRTTSAKRAKSATKPAAAPQAGLTSAPVGKRVGGSRIAILVNGSEGDLRPLLALALALLRKRHTVRMFTNANMVTSTIERGVDAVPVFADTKAVIHSLGGMSGLPVEAITKPAHAAKKWLQEHQGEYVPVMEALEGFQPHVLVVGAQVLMPAMSYEAIHHVPVIPVFLNRCCLGDEMFTSIIDRDPPRPSFFPVSEILDKQPVGFARTMRTGAWHLNEFPSEEDLAPGGSLSQLQRFLDAGEPPVAVGWGSMLAEGMAQAEMLQLALTAVMMAGHRCVVVGGWAEVDRLEEKARTGEAFSGVCAAKLAAFVRSDVCFVPRAPHTWLFPKCVAVIHHGGVGTTQAALRAGKPSVVTPVCQDQFFNSWSVTQTNAGIGIFKALPLITAAEIYNSLKTVTEAAFSTRVEKLGRKVRREEELGLARACDMVDGFLRGRIRLRWDGQWVRSLRVQSKKAPPPPTPKVMCAQ